MKNKMDSVITIHMVHMMSFNHFIIQLCSPNIEVSYTVEYKKEKIQEWEKIKEYVSNIDGKDVYI